MNILKKIKHWFWWTFKATEEDKCRYDQIFKGVGFMKSGKRISPEKVYENNLN